MLSGASAIVLGQIEARYGTIGMWPIVACFAPQIATISLIGPNAMALALQRYPHMAGTASSLMGVMQFGLGALFGAIVGQTYDGTIAPDDPGHGRCRHPLLPLQPRAGRRPELTGRIAARHDSDDDPATRPT